MLWGYRVPSDQALNMELVHHLYKEESEIEKLMAPYIKELAPKAAYREQLRDIKYMVNKDAIDVLKYGHLNNIQLRSLAGKPLAGRL